MSSIEDRDAAITRDPGRRAQVPGDGYAPQRYDYGRQSLLAETRPSFLTSELLFTVLTVIGIAITAATAADIDSRLSTMLISGVVAAYVISRGIAKAGSRSGANDPRDDLAQRS